MANPFDQFDSASVASAGNPFDQFDGNKGASSAIERFGTGLADPVWGAMQLASHVIPGVDAGIVDQMVKDREAQYAQQRQAAGSEGFDVARLAGNVLNPINLAGGAAAKGTTLGARMLAGAGVGAASAALGTPVTSGDYWGQKGQQALVGGLTGGAIPAIGTAASRVIQPQTSAAVKDVMAHGVTPTVGEMLGTGAKSMEERLMSMPVVGDIISYARRGSIEQMNRALYNMALEPIGETSTASIGREGVAEVAGKLSGAYHNLLQGRQIPLDQAFGNDISQIWNATSIMSNDARQQFRNIVLNKIINAQNANGMLDGTTMKAIDSQLGTYARKFGRDQNINNQMIGDALEAVQGALRSAVGRADPTLVPELSKIDQGWSIYARIRNAAARTGAKEGVITPGTLNQAVTALDNSVGKGATAKGTAPMRAFTDHVNAVLGSTYPDSGTTGRAITNMLLLGGSMFMRPSALLMGALMSAPYSSVGKKVISTAIAARPAGAQALANAVQGASQYAVPGAAQAAAR